MKEFENNIKVKEKTFKVRVRKIEETGNYIMSLKDGNGGPVISGQDYEETKENFLKALSLGNSIRNLRAYEAIANGSVDNVEWVDFNKSVVEFEEE